jgi:hypothetical protein
VRKHSGDSAKMVLEPGSLRCSATTLQSPCPCTAYLPPGEKPAILTNSTQQAAKDRGLVATAAKPPKLPSVRFGA